MNGLKYPHLEVSVLKLSEVKKDNESFRIDSEPYKKLNMKLNDNFSYMKLSQIAIINPSKTEIQNLDKQTKVTFLSMQNLGNGLINEREEGCIKEFMSGYTYFAENDILIAKITPCMEHGKCAIAIDLYNKIGFGSTEFNVFRIKDSRFVKEFVFCYLNREAIRKIAADNMVGTSGRQRVPTSFYEKLLIPIFPMSFQLEIQKLVKDSHKALESGKALYKEAENLLYESLGLDSKNPLQSILNNQNQIPNYTIATLKESFLKTGRLDAEYYQGKYEKNEEVIKSFQHKPLKSIVEIHKSIEPGSSFYRENGLPFVRIGNFDKFGISQSDVFLDSKDFAEGMLEDLYPRKDDILLSKDGSIGIAYVVENDLECVLSGAILRLKIKDKNSIKPQYLSLVLNSIITQLQAQRDCGGSIISHWRIEEIQNLVIPLLDSTIQEKIEVKVMQSFKLRRESKALLEQAKQKVESAIESGIC